MKQKPAKQGGMKFVLLTWMVATQRFLEFSPFSLGFHDPNWRAYFSDGLGNNHQLVLLGNQVRILLVGFHGMKSQQGYFHIPGWWILYDFTPCNLYPLVSCF